MKRVEGAVRFGVSMDPELLDSFDKVIEQKGYSNRSEAIRDLVRDYLVRQEWEEGQEIVGTITLVYNHHVRELTDALTALQHDYSDKVLSTLHIHLDHANCLEVIAVRGPSKEVQYIADRIIGIKGVKHGRLAATTTGKRLK